MGCCNEPATALAAAAPDPAQHVNYAKGMVLGVDDFTQEFAYLAGRDRWLAREAVGYGTTSGLRVVVEDDGAAGPRVRVGAGTAVVPSGQLVCVTGDLCASLNRWLAKPENAAAVSRLLNPVSPPVSPQVSPPAPGAGGTVSLYLTLCYADCLTRPVPIPGEPCRSEDELMAPSRVADDFRLELRTSAPPQTEEDAARDFVRWLRANVRVLDASPPPADDAASWLAALRAAAGPWLDAATLSPPASFETISDYLFDLSPPALVVAPDRAGDFLRVAFRFWVTELRPRWAARRCHRAVYPGDDCVLLARVGFEVVWVGGSPAGAWQVVDDATTVVVDESTRPVLTSLRLLNEWASSASALGTGAAAGGPAPEPPASGGGASLPVTTTDADLTLDASHYLVVVRGAAGPVTLTLPTSTRRAAGRVYVVKNAGTAAVTTEAAGRSRVDGARNATVAAGGAVTLVADGAGDWVITGRA